MSSEQENTKKISASIEMTPEEMLVKLKQELEEATRRNEDLRKEIILLELFKDPEAVPVEDIPKDILAQLIPLLDDSIKMIDERIKELQDTEGVVTTNA